MADLGSSLASLLQVPGLQQLLNQQMTQQNQQQPLRTAINQQAANMLPNSAFAGQGVTDQYGRPNMASIPQANYSTPAPSGMSPVLAGLLGAGGGAGLTLLLQKLLSNGGNSGGGGNASGSGGSGGGSSFSFGNGKSVMGNLASLFSKPDPTQNPNAPGGLPIPGGEFNPNTVYGQPQQSPQAGGATDNTPDYSTGLY